MNEDKMICAAFMNTESGRLYNATIETLALALFKDMHPTLVWCRQTHDERQYYRKIAQGQLELP